MRNKTRSHPPQDTPRGACGVPGTHWRLSARPGGMEAARVEAESIRERVFETARQDGLDRASGDLQDEIQQRAAELVDERMSG